jgi:hypothetical protein
MATKPLITAEDPGKPGHKVRESYRGEAGEMYRQIAEELDGPEPVAEVLAMLDQRAVALAGAYAHRSHAKWPPRPTRSGWSFQIISIGAPYDGSPVADTEDLVR